MLSGLRHFVMDTGAGFELDTNKFWALMTMAGSVLLTAFSWLYIVVVKLMSDGNPDRPRARPRLGPGGRRIIGGSSG